MLGAGQGCGSTGLALTFSRVCPFFGPKASLQAFGDTQLETAVRELPACAPYTPEVFHAAGDLLGGSAAPQPSAHHGGGLLEELTGPASTSAGGFVHTNGVMGSAAGRPAHDASSALGAADMFGGLSLGGESQICLSSPETGKSQVWHQQTVSSQCALVSTQLTKNCG